MDTLLSALDILIRFREAFFAGLLVTLKLAGVVWLFGIVGGSLLGWAAAHYPRGIGLPCRGITFLLSSVPVLVFLFWLHYPLQAAWNVAIDPFYTSALTFASLNIFGVAELLRAHIVDFPEQYRAAAKVCGLSRRQIACTIELPIIFRQIVPGLLMLQVSMLHLTLFASLISVDELFRTAQRINASIYRPVEIYTALAVFFIGISLPINGIAVWLRSTFTRNLSER